MLGLKSVVSAARYCRCHDELRNFLRFRSRMRQYVPASTRRWQHMRKTAIALYPRKAWSPRANSSNLSGAKADRTSQCPCGEWDKGADKSAKGAQRAALILQVGAFLGGWLTLRNFDKAMSAIPTSGTSVPGCKTQGL